MADVAQGSVLKEREAKQKLGDVHDTVAMYDAAVHK